MLLRRPGAVFGSVGGSTRVLDWRALLRRAVATFGDSDCTLDGASYRRALRRRDEVGKVEVESLLLAVANDARV